MGKDNWLVKVYGIPLVILGAVFLFTDVIMMSLGSEVLALSINPLKMLVDFLNGMIILSTVFSPVIASEYPYEIRG